MIKKLTALLACIILCYALLNIMKPSQTTQTNENALIVGTSADYPPYEKIDLATGKIVGFDIDLIEAIAARLGKTVTYVDMPFNALIMNLAAGKIDLIAAGLCITQEREKAVLFSDVYLENDPIVIIYKKNQTNINSLQDLYGKTVAVNTGYTADTYLSKFSQIALVRLESSSDSILAVQTNTVDACATAYSSCQLFLHQAQADMYSYFTLPDSSDRCAFAYAKNNDALKKDIDSILDALKKDGSLEQFKMRWNFA